MKEHYVKWDPIPGIPTQMWVDSLTDDGEGLCIVLRSSEPTSSYMYLHFEHYLIYRNTDETNRGDLWGTASFEIRKWPLFITKDSALIDWIKHESAFNLNEHKLTHYLIATGIDAIDVVVNINIGEPKVWFEADRKMKSELGKLSNLTIDGNKVV